MALKDMTGQTFGRLQVIQRAYPNTKDGVARWLCKCECGNETVVIGSNLRKGLTKSCGCLFRESRQTDVAKEYVRKMGLSNRKHFGCMICGSDKHYAKGLCKNCYMRRWKVSQKKTA